MENTGYQNTEYPVAVLIPRAKTADLSPNEVDQEVRFRKPAPRSNTPDEKSALVEQEGDDFEDLEWEPTSWISIVFHSIQSGIGSLCKTPKSKSVIKIGTIVVALLLYNAYLIAAIAYQVRNDMKIDWCGNNIAEENKNGIGFLIILTGLTYFGIVYYYLLKPFLAEPVTNNIFKPIGTLWDKCWKFLIFRLLFSLIIIGGLVAFLIIDSKDNRRRLISASGIPILVCIGILLSKNPSRIVWRHVFWGTALQFIFGLLILRWQLGKDVVQCVSDKVESFLKFTDAGSSFVYGYLATGYNSADQGVTLDKPIVLSSTFAFGALSVVFWFSFVVGILYHLGAMTWAIVKIGWLLQITVGTTAAESLNAAANIFLGQTEAPLVIKPYFADLTNSEMHSIATGGFATIAGTVLGAFISFGISASHLLSASFMSAPAALAFSKILWPETKKTKTTSEQIYERKLEKHGSVLNAASESVSQAIMLVANIVASIIAVTACVAFTDAILAWFGLLIGFGDLSFQWLLGKLFYPFAFIIGVDTSDLEVVSRLLGIKTVINEFVAYEQLASLTATEISDRSKAIATYALCSFANFSSIGIQLGGLGALAPHRRGDLAKVIWRAFVAGNAAALMTACVAGALL